LMILPVWGATTYTSEYNLVYYHSF